MAFTRLRYHLVFGTKYGLPLITPEVEDFLYPVLGRAANNTGGRSIRIGGVEDHVHIICAIPPDIAVDQFVRKLKSQAAAATSRKFPTLTDRYANLDKFLWKPGYGGFTLNPLNMGGIISYVENQKEHHARGTPRPAYERIDRDESTAT